jgi:hypothetical protein
MSRLTNCIAVGANVGWRHKNNSYTDVSTGFAILVFKTTPKPIASKMSAL